MYHLAFVTRDTRNASSPAIADYNAFVQGQAALNPSLTGTDMGVDYFAIGSTDTVNARDNALVSAPVYLLDSTKIADGFADMWDSSLDAPFNITQFGDIISELAQVWTGSDTDGEAFNDGLARTLGSVFLNTRAGFTNVTNGQWISADQASSDNSRHFYALSEKLTVPTSGGVIPEATSFAVWLGLVGTVALSNRRRK